MTSSAALLNPIAPHSEAGAILALARVKPGPFNGLFDNIAYDSPGFLPIFVTIALLGFVFVSAVWFLLRRRRTRNSSIGFEVRTGTKKQF